MLQWADEIRRGTKEDTLKILVFHSSARNKLTMEDLMEADVVLTTYPVLEYEYRKIVDMNKVPCTHCGKKLLPRSLVWHNKYFCGPDAVRTMKQSKTEKTAKKAATLKAMQTLKITKVWCAPSVGLFSFGQCDSRMVVWWLSRCRCCGGFLLVLTPLSGFETWLLSLPRPATSSQKPQVGRARAKSGVAARPWRLRWRSTTT